MGKPTPENLVKAECKDWLGYNGFFQFPILQGLGCYPGIPDTIIVKAGIVLFNEYKGPKGKQSPGQVKFEQDLTEHGGLYLISRGYEDIENKFNKIKNER